MEHVVIVAPPYAPKGHQHPALHVCEGVHDPSVFDDHLEIAVKELEHKIEILVFGGEDIEKEDDVWVVQFLQVFDFADGIHAETRGEDGLGFDFFNGDARGRVGFGVSEVDDGIGTFSDFLIWHEGKVSGLIWGNGG